MSIKFSSLGLRHFITAASIIFFGFLMTGIASAKLSPTPNVSGTIAHVNGVTIQNVIFKNNEIMMSGNVYLPKDFEENKEYAAIVVLPPGGGVKEQTAGLYALKLAEEGFVTLAFDASHQGASGGFPRLIDDPIKRVGDFYSAVDYLTTLPYVNNEEIGALGICAGSGITVKASMIDRRIKALATVSAVDLGAVTRRGWLGKTAESEFIPILESVAKQRSAEAVGAAPVYINYIPELGDTTVHRDLQEAAEYYLTERGQYPTAPNKMLMTSLGLAASFYGFEGVDVYLTQPLLIIAGGDAGSLWQSQELNDRAVSTKKELYIIPGATHMDLYDGDGATTAAKKLVPFFKKNLE